MGVGEKLRDARMERNLTLRDISNKTRISEKFLEKIESGVLILLQSRMLGLLLEAMPGRWA
jgi:cytoskeletal protein RodZ